VELVYTRALEARARKGLRVRASPCAPEQTLIEWTTPLVPMKRQGLLCI